MKPFVTCSGERALVTGTWEKKGAQGTLEVMRLGVDDQFHPWLKRGATRAESFTPHGLSIVPCSTAPGWEGKALLYAIHSDSFGKNRTVEVFEIQAGRFVYLRSLGAVNRPALGAINSIAAMPNGTVFLSFFGVCAKKQVATPRLSTLSPGEKAPTDALLRFRPTRSGSAGMGQWEVYGTGWGGANGLSYSARHGVLLVAGFHKKLFHAVPVDANTGTLDFTRWQQITLPGNPDNISELANGHWMASAVPGVFSAAIRLYLENFKFPPTPYLFDQCNVVEVAIDPLRIVAVTSMPRCLTQPSTVWRDGDRFYTSRIRQPGVASWTVPKP